MVPIRADTLDALAEVHQCGLVPDLVYLDSEHSFDRVSRELAFCTSHWPAAAIVGDDFNQPPVAQAARWHAQSTRRRLFGHGTTFWFEACNSNAPGLSGGP